MNHFKVFTYSMLLFVCCQPNNKEQKNKTSKEVEKSVILHDENLTNSIDYSLKNFDLYEVLESEIQFEKTFDISIISEEEYNSYNNQNSNGVIPNEILYSIYDSVLTINLLNGTDLELISTPNAEEISKRYEYIGHIDFLEQFVVSTGFYESYEYSLFSEFSGKKITSLNEMPIINTNRSSLYTIYLNPYEESSDLDFYKINDKELQLIFSGQFVNWMISNDENHHFWINDNTIVLKASHPELFWESRNLDLIKYEHLKITFH